MSGQAEPFDAFSELQLERRPVVSAKLLESNYHAASARAASGDDAGSGSPERLNRARKILSGTPSRLRHLMQLSGYFRQKNSRIPEHLAQSGFELEPTLKSADQLLSRYSGTSSRVEQALLAAEVIECQQQLLAQQAKLNGLQQQAAERLSMLDAEWTGVMTEEGAEALARLADEFTYLERWLAQVAERLHKFQLADKNF